MPSRLAFTLASLCAAVALLGACTASRAPAGSFGEARVDPATVPGEPALEAEMHQIVNTERRAHGLPPLDADPMLTAIARLHSHDMIEAGFVGHVSPTTGRPEDRLHRAGYLARVSLENIAVHQSVEGAHTGLMDSPGHRANILADDVVVAGVGIVARDGDLFVTQLFADPAPLEDPSAVARVLLLRIEAARADAGLTPLRGHTGLQAIVDEMAGRMPVPLTPEALDRAGRAALTVAAEDDTLGRIAVSAQTASGEADLTLPAPALGEGAVALAIGGASTEGPDGRPTLVILVLIGSR